MSFLFVDRILSLNKGESITGLKHVTLDDTYLSRDESGQYYFVSTLIGEALGQLAAWCAMDYLDYKVRPVAGVCKKAIMHRPVAIGETLLLESFIDKLDEDAVAYHSVASVNDEPVFTIDSAIGPMLPMQDFIADDVVRQQFAAIYRPGDKASVMPTTALVDLLAPRPEVHLNFDGVCDFEPGASLTAIKYISKSAAYYADHFPLKPVYPMTLLLEAKLRLARHFIQQSNLGDYQPQAMQRLKMNEFVQPGDTLVTKMVVKELSEDLLIFQYRSEVDGKRVCVAEAVFKKA